MKRYFSVVYFSTVTTGQLINSNLNFISDDGSFPNRKEIIKHIKAEAEPNILANTPLIVNIMEFSEKDWNDYTKE